MTLTSPPRTLTRRSKDRLGNEQFAAAQAISISNPNHAKYLQQTVRTSRIRSSDPWKWFDKIGEVHYALSRAARIAGYSTLFAETMDPDGDWVRVKDGSPADDIVQGIYSKYGGLRGFISTYFTLMKVTGDCLLIRVRDEGGVDGYHFLSPDAIDASSIELLTTEGAGPLKWITSPAGASADNMMVRDVRREDVLGRVWFPSARFVDLPDSALGALETECATLFATTQNMKAKLVSRFAAAGILFVPDKMQNLQVKGKDGMLMAENGLEYLIEAMTLNMDRWEDAESLMPILMSGPGEVGEQIKHLILDREVFQTDIEIRRELIDRIYTGLDIQAQATKGVGESTHWSAWAVTDEELRLVAKPDLQNMCWALTRLILQDQLMRDFNMKVDQAALYRISFDMSEAASKTNQQEDARQLNDRGMLSNEITMLVAGFSSDQGMDEEEYVRWIGRTCKNPVLMAHIGKIADIDWDKVAMFGGKTGPAGADGTTPKSGPGVGDPGSPNPSDQERD